MDELTARDYLARGVYEIINKKAAWEIRERYYRGDHDLPFAPEGVNEEYMSLREMSVANWVKLAMDAPVQRCRADGFRTGRSEDVDQVAWREIWQPNRLDARQRTTYTQMMVHGRGLMSVWPNASTPKSPVIRPENGKRVHLEMDPEDPFTVKWVVKTFTLSAPPPSPLWLPETLKREAVCVAVVYDASTWARFEKRGGELSLGGDWRLVAGGEHPLGEPPFVPFDLNADADGVPYSGIEPLIPAQNAINTIRFNALLAMQFSAYRQRVFVGYDPLVRDAAGEVVWQMNEDGSKKLDASGQPIPMLRSPGRMSVDRALVFPGQDTKVFDLPESNLSNYIEVLGEFLTELFATGQIPPQYLLSRMANLSGDALAGAESTLASLVADLQRWMGEALEQVMRLANRARGESAPDFASEVVWADTEARSFAQVVDAIVKLTGAGFPRKAAWEMIPGATIPKVDRWLEQADAQAETDPVLRAARALALTDAPEATGDTGSGL